MRIPTFLPASLPRHYKYVRGLGHRWTFAFFHPFLHISVHLMTFNLHQPGLTAATASPLFPVRMTAEERAVFPLQA